MNTCKENSETNPESGERYFLEFLSDPKLLNTAVTRAKSLLAVVGDPISLCTVGTCRRLWRDFIKRCNDNGALYGTTMEQLEQEVLESVKSIPLNPDAVSFTPRFAARSSQDEAATEPSAVITADTEEAAQLPPASDEDVTRGETVDDTTEEDSDISTMSHDGEGDLDSVSFDDFQGEYLEDPAVFPIYMDEIIRALIAKCEQTRKREAARKSMLQESDFPFLQQGSGATRNKQPYHIAPAPRPSALGQLAERFPGDYEMVTKNGRVEIRLVNVGFQLTPPTHARRLHVSTRLQECLQPEVLRRLLQEDPERYLACTLRLNPDKGCLAFAEVQDTCTPDIEIIGRVRQAFDRDTVVIEKSLSNSQGKIIGE